MKVGDFVTCTKRSIYPMVVVQLCENEHILCSVVEYKGDYVYLHSSEVKPIKVSDHEKVSILSNFGEWWQVEYKHI